ncbi:hypothetical protein MMC17_001768 [Xylographa soralifera]|nr:hypothetical protein [Xylographa soralifera]
MYSTLLHILAFLAAAVTALPPLNARGDDLSALCNELVLLVDVSSESFVFDAVIDTDWDTNDLTIKATGRDSATAFNPIIGKVSIENSFNIRAQFCTPKDQ